MTDYKALCAEVFAYHEGQDKYDFSHLNPYDRENAAFDAWQEIKAELKHALAQSEPEGPSDKELTQFLFENFRGPIEFLCDAEEEAHLMIRSHVKFARAVLARWGNL
jgi:hypothetical protein